MTEACERELYPELTKLDQSFVEWRNETISSAESSHRIHEWETGPSRALFKQYNYGLQDMSVAYAIVVGILDEEEAPAELVEAMGSAIHFCRSLQERDQLREREGHWWSH